MLSGSYVAIPGWTQLGMRSHVARLERLESMDIAPEPTPAGTPAILAIDVGGTHVKIKCCASDEVRRTPSGPTMTAAQMVAAVLHMAEGWDFDLVSMGYPGPVLHGKIVREPYNLGPGWVAFDFAAAFGRPVRIINDAAMQALGSYEGGRMLFLGLGTGLGSVLILNGEVQPLELAHLPYR